MTRNLAAAVFCALFMSAFVAERADAIIVWQKGNEIWSMKDDFSAPGVLVKLADVQGATYVGRPNTSASGKTIVFEAQTGTSGNFATGVYKYYGNTITRLSAAPTTCTVNGSSCTRRHLDAEVMGTTGRVAFESRYSVSGSLTAEGDLQTMPTTQGAVAAFNPLCSGTLRFPADPAANPADGAEIAYVGCRDSSDPPRYQLVVSKADHAGERVIAKSADSLVDPSFSTDGKQVVVGKRGDTSPGLWVYDTFLTTASLNGHPYTYYKSRRALNLPLESGQSPSPRFIGTDKIIFAHQGELWTIPATCSSCAFPGGATKVTTDGADTTKADTAPTWTAQTTLGVVRYAPGTFTPGSTNPDGDPAVSTDEPDEAYQDADEECPPENPWDCWSEGGYSGEEVPPEEEYPPFEDEYPPYEEDPGFGDEDFSSDDEFPSDEDFGEDFGGGSTPPRLRGFQLGRNPFKPYTAKGDGGGKLGTSVLYTLSKRASVAFRLERATRGRLLEVRSEVGSGVRKVCEKQTKRNRQRRACARYEGVKGGFKVVGKRGKNNFKFTGWWRGKRLAEGRYRLVAVATDVGNNKSNRVRAEFRVK